MPSRGTNPETTQMLRLSGRLYISYNYAQCGQGKLVHNELMDTISQYSVPGDHHKSQAWRLALKRKLMTESNLDGSSDLWVYFHVPCSSVVRLPSSLLNEDSWLCILVPCEET